MKKFLAMWNMPVCEQLASQMWNFAALCNVAQHSGLHRIVFFEEHLHIGRGLKLHLHFKDLPFELITMNSLKADEAYCTIPLNSRVAVNSSVFRLEPTMNYNFDGLFISYKYWWPIHASVRRMYRFPPAVVALAQSVVEPLRGDGRSVVSVHVRRTDFVSESPQGPANLTRAYYDAAFRKFDLRTTRFLIFSDDLPWCHATFSDLDNVLFAEGNDAIVDMCAMTLCDHNIIANSGFSFWGAFLNENPGKKMIGPARAFKLDATIPYSNYAWLPDDFILLDTGNDA